MSEQQIYRVFDVELARKERLTPSLMRCVFGGASLRGMKMDGPDQRIKLLLPPADGSVPALADDGEWYRAWLALPKERRPVMRTYTLRDVDAARGEMAVEFVIHGTEGPASAWAVGAEPGAKVQIVGPNREFAGDCGGYEWLPPDEMTRALVIGDETALPAIKGILEQIARRPAPARVQAFIEVPRSEDCVDLSAYAFAEVFWLPRQPVGAYYGERLLESVREHVWLPQSAADATADAVQEVEEGELLWETAGRPCGSFFGWVAAESSAVKALRRYLSGERAAPRETITFMAYWNRERRRKE